MKFQYIVGCVLAAILVEGNTSAELSLKAGDGGTLTRAELSAKMSGGQNLDDDDIRKRLIDAVADGRRGGSLEARTFTNVQVLDHRVQIRSEARMESESIDTSNGRSSDDRNRIDLQHSTEGIPRWFLAYRERKDNQASRYAIKVGLLRLAEYNSSVSARESKNFIKFNDNVFANSWSKMESSNFMDPNGATHYTIRTSMTVRDGKYARMNVTLVTYFVDSVTVNDDGQALTPSGLKFTLIINNFPFEMPNGKLALVQGFWESNSRVKENENGNTKMNIADAQAQFVWDSKVMADGQEADVDVITKASTSTSADVEGVQEEDGEGRTAQIMVFGFPMAERLVWDPYMAATDESMNSAATAAKFSLFALGLIWMAFM